MSASLQTDWIAHPPSRPGLDDYVLFVASQYRRKDRVKDQDYRDYQLMVTAQMKKHAMILVGGYEVRGMHKKKEHPYLAWDLLSGRYYHIRYYTVTSNSPHTEG